MKKHLFFSIVFLCWITLSGNVMQAQGQDSYTDSFDKGLFLFETGRYTAAFDIFSSLCEKNPEDEAPTFMIGRSAFEAGDYETAVMIFDRLLIINPQSIRAHLELGRCFMKLKAYQTAKLYFGKVLESNPPEPVRTNIVSYIEAADTALKQHFFSGFFKLFSGWNDNPGALPQSSIIHVPALNDLAVTLDSEQADYFLGSHLKIGHKFRPESMPFTWESAFSAYQVFYDTQNSESISYVSAQTGPVFSRPSFTVSPGISLSYMDRHFDKYMDSVAGLLSIQHRFTPKAGLMALLKAEQKDFADDARDADAFSIMCQPVIEMRDIIWYLSVTLSQEDARHGEYDLKRLEISPGAKIPLPIDMALNLGGRFSRSEYDDLYSMFNTSRTDTLYSLFAGIEKKLFEKKYRMKSLTASLDYIWTNAGSTIDLYDYTQNQVLLSLIMTF